MKDQFQSFVILKELSLYIQRMCLFLQKISLGDPVSVSDHKSQLICKDVCLMGEFK